MSRRAESSAAIFRIIERRLNLIDGPTALKDGQDQVDVRFSAESGGVRVIKTYTFHRGRYDADVKHEIVNLTDKPLTPSVYLQLTRDGNKPEGESALYYVYTGPAVFTEQEKFRKIEFSEIEKNKVQLPKPADNGWIGMIQHYFVSAWVPPAGAQREYYARTVDKNLYSIGSIVCVAGAGAECNDDVAVDACTWARRIRKRWRKSRRALTWSSTTAG